MIVVADFALAENRHHPEIVTFLRDQLEVELTALREQIHRRHPTRRNISISMARCPIGDRSAAEQLLRDADADLVLWGRIYDPRYDSIVNAVTNVDMNDVTLGNGSEVSAGNASIVVYNNAEIFVVPHAMLRATYVRDVDNLPIVGTRIAIRSVAEIDAAALVRSRALIPLSLLDGAYAASRGNYDEAADAYDNAISELKDDLRSPSFWIEVAIVNLAAKRPQAAIDAANQAKARAVAPQDQVVSNAELALICAALGRYGCATASRDAAIVMLDEMVAQKAPMNPEDVVMISVASIFIAAVATKLDDFSGAIQLATRVVDVVEDAGHQCATQGEEPAVETCLHWNRLASFFAYLGLWLVATLDGDVVSVLKADVGLIRHYERMRGSRDESSGRRPALEAPDEFHVKLQLLYAVHLRTLNRVEDAEREADKGLALLSSLSPSARKRVLREVEDMRADFRILYESGRARPFYGRDTIGTQMSLGSIILLANGNSPKSAAIGIAGLWYRYASGFDHIGLRLTFVSDGAELPPNSSVPSEGVRGYAVDIHWLKAIFTTRYVAAFVGLGVGVGELSRNGSWTGGAIGVRVFGGVRCEFRVVGRLSVAVDAEAAQVGNAAYFAGFSASGGAVVRW